MRRNEPAKPEPSAPARYLTPPASQTAPLFDAPSAADAPHVAHSLGVIARARFMTDVARETHITREAPHRSLSEDDAPRLTTPLGVICALGVRLTAKVRASP
jgi:probable addiction module antidote protein